MDVWWIIYCMPLTVVLAGWVVLISTWRSESHRSRALLAMLMTTAPAAWAVGTLAYARLVKPLPHFDPTVELLGALLSSGALIAAIRSRRCARRWIPRFTIAMSGVMLLFWLLEAGFVA